MGYQGKEKNYYCLLYNKGPEDMCSFFERWRRDLLKRRNKRKENESSISEKKKKELNMYG